MDINNDKSFTLNIGLSLGYPRCHDNSLKMVSRESDNPDQEPLLSCPFQEDSVDKINMVLVMELFHTGQRRDLSTVPCKKIATI